MLLPLDGVIRFEDRSRHVRVQLIGSKFNTLPSGFMKEVRECMGSRVTLRAIVPWGNKCTYEEVEAFQNDVQVRAAQVHTIDLDLDLDLDLDFDEMKQLTTMQMRKVGLVTLICLTFYCGSGLPLLPPEIVSIILKHVQSARTWERTKIDQHNDVRTCCVM